MTKQQLPRPRFVRNVAEARERISAWFSPPTSSCCWRRKKKSSFPYSSGVSYTALDHNKIERAQRDGAYGEVGVGVGGGHLNRDMRLDRVHFSRENNARGSGDILPVRPLRRSRQRGETNPAEAPKLQSTPGPDSPGLPPARSAGSRH